MLKLEVSYRGMLLIGLALVSLWLVVRLWPVILLVITGFIFMTALLPYVEWLVQRGLRRGAAVVVVLVVVLAVLIGLVALVVPAMVNEFRDLQRNLPDDAKQVEDLLAKFNIDVQLQDRARNIDWGSLVSGRVAFDYGQRIFAITLSILTIIFLTVYLLMEAPRLSRFLFQFVPAGREAEVSNILASLGRVVGGYIRGQAITSLAISLYTLVVLLALDARNPLAFAVLAGFADIIPIVGAALSTLPAPLAMFHDSPTRAVIAFGLLVLYQQFEDRYLVPRVYGSTLNLPPLIVLIAVLAGGELLGVTGVLLALPAAAAGRVGLDYWLEKRKSPMAVPIPEEEPFAPDEPRTPAGERASEAPPAGGSAANAAAEGNRV